MAETHNDVIRDKHLPRVGDTVRSKKYKTLWRVIEKKEVWLNTSDDPETGDCRAIPAIYLCYWRVQEGKSARSRQDARVCLLPARQHL
ncbi:MAG: hypothetical protein MZU91_08025 [Desulfosudis oleivorans]|nr:hypothetical protein [Desulfosudis oleivorans]